MKYWLVKSDPEDYGWNEFVIEKKTEWTGVRNYAARNHLKEMKENDLVLFYHSGGESSVVGISKVTKEFFRDNTADQDGWAAVELEAVQPLSNSVTLSEIKKEKELKNMPLVKIGRLSVMPVTKAEFEKILSMGETKL